jgi:molybdenum cofactor cytidylyltransferase
MSADAAQPIDTRSFDCVGILLAAGSGSRFDPTGMRNKLLQPLADGRPVALAAASLMLRALPRVIAVLRPGADELAEMLATAGCDITFCADASAGMGASLAHALGLAADADGWIIALADMPHLQSETVQRLMEALAAGAQIAAPFYQGRRGNPVGFGRAHLQALLALSGDTGARALLGAHALTGIDVNDPGVLHDIDTPQDLR